MVGKEGEAAGEPGGFAERLRRLLRRAFDTLLQRIPTLQAAEPERAARTFVAFAAALLLIGAAEITGRRSAEDQRGMNDVQELPGQMLDVELAELERKVARMAAAFGVDDLGGSSGPGGADGLDGGAGGGRPPVAGSGGSLASPATA